LVESPDDFLFNLVVLGIELNVILALFNLLPVPPLDGSKVASYGLPGSIGEKYDRVMGPYGFVVLLLLLMSGILGRILRPIQNLVLGLLFGMVR
jgi:Zn-dependent protease